jgi:endogenous inhibitor of DNA gyrase (YacG/DUF329 family)
MSCPICSKLTDDKYRPFCSRRCANVDLGRWLQGSYAVAGEAANEEELIAEERPETRPTRH